MRADTGETVEHEALLRLDWNDGSDMSAGDVLPAAERLGRAWLINHVALGL